MHGLKTLRAPRRSESEQDERVGVGCFWYVLVVIFRFFKGRSRERRAVEGDNMVIVIGAGIAGLACARELERARVDVVVLEARDRIGGRIWTDDSLGAPVDLGASWIHGHWRNPLMKFARKHDLEVEWTNYLASGLYDAERRWPRAAAQRAMEYSDKLYAWVERLCHAHPSGRPDISVAAALAQDISRGHDARPSDPRIFDWSLAMMTLNEGIGAGRLSLRYFEDDAPYTGDDYLFNRGYKGVLDVLADGLDVRLNHRVERVDWSGDEIIVQTNRGMLEAEQIVVTLPLGVLAAGDVVFEPSLPEPKQRAIDELGVGLLDKVVVEFDEVFWRGDDASICVLEPPYEWASFVLNLYPLTGRPILVGFLGGEEARAAENASDGELVEQLLVGLRTCFGDAVTAPRASRVTRWGQDPYSKGAYAHIPVGATGAFYDELAASIDRRVFFAGEATSRDNPATAHGAYESGVREAKQILAVQ